MKISTKGRYAVRLMIDLALRDSKEYISLKDISSRQDISMKYLEQIVRLLHSSHLLKSTRGPQGGYKLTRAPKDYTIGDILRITEGSLAPVSCLDEDPNECASVLKCPTIDFWTGLYQCINDYVDSVTLADLTEQYKSKIGYDFMI
jgi:Rrf2 family protein